MSTIRRLLTSFLGRPNRRQPARTTQLGFETLEAREVPAVVTANLVGTTLLVNGTSGADRILIRHTASRLYVHDAARGVDVAIGGAGGTSVLGRTVAKVVVNAHAGDDLVDLYQKNVNPVRLPVELYGGGGRDTLRGGLGADILYGHDRLSGGSEVDYLYGNGGNDTIYGQSGSDHLYGGSGNDVIIGGNQTDSLYGEDGNDWLEAGTATELADGGAGTNWNAHRWAINGTKATDVNQTFANRCVILASMAAAADWGIDLAGRVTYLGNFRYQVRMYDRAIGNWVNVAVRFDGSIVSTTKGQRVEPMSEGVDATRASEFWTILFQRAYVQHFYGVDPANGDRVSALPVGLPGEDDHSQALAAVTGWATENPGDWADDITTPDLAVKLQDHLNRGDILTVGGTGHAYAVSSVWKSKGGTWMVELYNPWGFDATHDPNNDGLTSNIPFTAFGDNDGRISMTVDALRAGFDHFFVAKNPGIMF